MSEKQLLIILGPPRSFTTIVSAMLGQHPQMYGLPEIHLFGAETVGEWWNQCGQATFNMDHGLVRVIAELYYGEQTETTVQRSVGWLRRRAHFTTGLLMEELASRVFPRMLVEKSPSVVYRIESLERLYAMFSSAVFLHLVRHPRGHGESVIRYLNGRRKLGPIPRTHWLLHLASFPDEAGVLSEMDPQKGWLALHSNICKFLEAVPAAQKMRMRGEDLLTNRDQGLAKICDWLELRTDPAAIEPMMHPERSPYACYGPPGANFGNDRSFLKNPTLRPERGENHSLDGPLSWRKDGHGFLPEVRDLAVQFGYQ